MLMVSYLDKNEKDRLLPMLFDLLYENMCTIAPGLPYEQEKALWLSQVSPAMDKPERQILICRQNGKPVGYLQYYIRQDLLMLEELQLVKSCRSTTALLKLIRFLISGLPAELTRLEAYADKRNTYSQALMQKLGMESLPMPEEAPFVHYRGSLGGIRRRFERT